MSMIFEQVTRWTPKRKAKIVDDLHQERVTVEDVCRTYEISESEIRTWIEAYTRGGLAALRVTRRA